VARIVKIADASPYGEPLFHHLKNLFSAIDKGNDRLGIPTGYNGGLFAEDELLNSLVISDEPLRKLTDLSGYDFKEDLRVNVLGHIFEQSITDLEEIKRLVGADRDEGNPFHESKLPPELKIGRRKKEGIFYTPDYIVDYVVEHTLGAYLHGKEEEFKKKHNLSGTRTEEGYDKRERMAYTEYQHVLQNSKVLDPACGSGAFLAGAFRYLYGENRRVAEILGSGIFSEEGFVRSILTDNLFGVDINEESVEITKLSLWLMTAQKDKSLTSLDDNIKVGNSLIEEVGTDPNTAFDWNAGFPKIMSAGGFDVIIGNPPFLRMSVCCGSVCCCGATRRKSSVENVLGAAA
jgi:type I restriction-modification system DNA methylase subunit